MSEQPAQDLEKASDSQVHLSWNISQVILPSVNVAHMRRIRALLDDIGLSILRVFSLDRGFVLLRRI